MTTKHWFGDYVFEVENFMLGDQCARLIEHAEGIGFGEARSSISDGGSRSASTTRGSRQRNNAGSLCARQ
jgi:hypothetical protein